ADRMMKTFTNVQLKGPDPVIIPAHDSIKQVGFAESESILPYTKRSFAGYRLLSEYFAFPYKFLFFDIYGLDLAVEEKFGSHFDIIVPLKDTTLRIAAVTADNFRLGCTPIVNLFSRLCDPVYISQQRYEYQIHPDIHRQMSTEIYSVDEVFTADPVTNAVREF